MTDFKEIKMTIIKNPEPNGSTMNPITDYKELLEAAYDEFGKGEGCIERAYVCKKGYPTIGTGKLFLDKKKIENDKAMASWKEVYKGLPLSKTVNGKKVYLTDKEKGDEFDKLVTAMRNGTLKTSVDVPKYIIEPKLSGILTKEDNKAQVFPKTFNHYYKRVIDDFGKDKFDSLPQSTQLSLIHCYMGGKANSDKVKKAKDGTALEISEKLVEIFSANKSAHATQNLAYQAVVDSAEVERIERLRSEPLNATLSPVLVQMKKDNDTIAEQKQRFEEIMARQAQELHEKEMQRLYEASVSAKGKRKMNNIRNTGRD